MPVNLDAQLILKRRRYEELMQAGKVAYKQGNRKLAHDQWREAATVDPYNEQVWLTLFRVLDTDEDRIACLENIIAINPMNVQARRRLRAYQEHPSVSPEVKPARADSAAAGKKPAKANARPITKKAAAKTKKPQAGKATVVKTKPASESEPRRSTARGLVIIVIATLLVLLLAVVIGLALMPR